MMQNFVPGLEGIQDHVKLPDWMPKATLKKGDDGGDDDGDDDGEDNWKR